MKKILLFSAILIFLFSGKKALASSNTYFKWIKTEIKVPLHADIYDYIEQYEIEYYENGILSENYVIHTCIDGTTFSVIQTDIIGSYYVTYEAYNYDETVFSKADICFTVFDDKSPVIIGDEYIKIEYETNFKSEQYFNVIDNYDNYEDLDIRLDLSNVSFSILGIYDAKIIAKDSSNNQSEMSFKIEVIDTKPPTLAIIKELLLSYNEKPDINKYIAAKDNYDNYVEVVLENIKNDVLGVSSIVVSAKDSSNNKTKQTFICRIIDDIYPTITLNGKNEIVYIEEIEDIDDLLMSFIENYSDNYSKKEDLILEIETDLKEIKVGYYEIKYIVTDEFANSSEELLYVQILEQNGPVIICEDYYQIEIGNIVDLLTLVSVSDPYDSDVERKIEVIDNNVNFNKKGTYYAYFRAFNNSGKYSIKKINIEITDTTNNSSNKATTFITNNYIFISIILVESIIVLIVIFSRKKTRDIK